MDPGIFARLELLLPNLLAKMRDGFQTSPLCREFVLLKKNWTYYPGSTQFEYYYDDHPDLDSQIRILENSGLVEDITDSNVKRYSIKNEFADYLTGQPIQSDDQTVPSPDETYLFRNEGHIWTLSFEGKKIQVRDSKGLSHICQLLRRPNQLIRAVDLIAAAAGQRVGSIGVGSAGEMLTDETINNYRRRIWELVSEIDEAERNNDLGRKQMLSDEKEQIESQLRSALGLGGRRRKASDDAEAARKTVSNAISRAITGIREHHPKLADHLQRFIDRGQSLSYTDDRIPWNF